MAKWKRVRSCSYSEAQKAKRSSLYGPLRVARLCVLSIIVPGLMLSIPLYMRYNVYIQQVYPVGMSDIRLLDSRISTTWCQRQVVWSNATFNAFLMSEQPEMQPDTIKVSMTRHIILEDDMKEYWGFYLLRGSTVTVSTCVRWPGASLIMIRGHKHLKQCAYIGDDSSEELDEIFEGDGNNNTSADYDISNKPTNMKKIREGVVINTEHLDESSSHQHHKSFHASTVEDTLRDNWKYDGKKGQNVHLIYAEQVINPQKTKDKEEYKSNVNVVNIPVEPTSEKPKTSREVYEVMLKQLRKMGPKGKSVLNQLHQKLNEEHNETVNISQVKHSQDSPETREKAEEKQNIQKTSTQTSPVYNKKDLQNKKRRRRQISLIDKTASQLTKHDEEADNAAEEMELQPDGVADVRGRVTEMPNNDQSNSEYWSSFSSSEERLLECEGLLLNLPLTPHHICHANESDSVLARASRPNTVSYKVPSNGYYFFVFNSENEVQPNFFRIHFRLEKTTYNVTNAVAACRNQTGSCSLPLRFWSEDKVILELPVRSNDTLWNEEFLAVSTCEPRTALYVICVIAVPFLIILFAFQ